MYCYLLLVRMVGLNVIFSWCWNVFCCYWRICVWSSGWCGMCVLFWMLNDWEYCCYWDCVLLCYRNCWWLSWLGYLKCCGYSGVCMKCLGKLVWIVLKCCLLLLVYDFVLYWLVGCWNCCCWWWGYSGGVCLVWFVWCCWWLRVCCVDWFSGLFVVFLNKWYWYGSFILMLVLSCWNMVISWLIGWIFIG